jgi:hypothetical protein
MLTKSIMLVSAVLGCLTVALAPTTGRSQGGGWQPPGWGSNPTNIPNQPTERVSRIAGIWSGIVSQPGEESYSVRMEIDQVGYGTTEYAALKCGGRLTGSATGIGVYSFQERITHGRATATETGCIDGTITVRRIDEKTISWSWNGSWQGKSITASATLQRQ